MKLLENILYLTACEYIKDDKGNGIVPLNTYSGQRQRGKIKTIGRGGNGSQVYIEFDSLPPLYKQLVFEKYGDPYEYASLQPLRDLCNRIDVKAIEFFDRYLKPNGHPLDDHLKED